MQSSVTRSRTSITKSLPASFKLSIFTLSSESYNKILCFTSWNEVFHTEKRIVSSLETIFETNRHRWRDGEVIALHPQTPYSSERQRKGERGDGKMENKYPVGKFIRYCNDSVLYRNEYYFISSLLLFLIINSYRMLYLKNLPPRKLSFPYLYTLPQSCVVA